MENNETTAPSSPEVRPIATPSATTGQKNPMVAGFLACFPGIGHIYNGLYVRGIVFFVTVAAMMPIAARHEQFGFAVAFVWIFNVVDAFRQATLINYGYAQDLGMLDLPERPRASQAGLAVGVILFALGLFATLDQFFEVDLEWLFDLWPVVLMVIGGALIWAWIRDRNKTPEIDDSEEDLDAIPEIEP